MPLPRRYWPANGARGSTIIERLTVLGYKTRDFAGRVVIEHPNDSMLNLTLRRTTSFDGSRLRRMMDQIDVTPEKWHNARNLIN